MIFPLTAPEIEQLLKPLRNLHSQGEKKCSSFKQEYEMHTSNAERRNCLTSTLRQIQALSKLSLFKQDSFHQSSFPIEQTPTLPTEL